MMNFATVRSSTGAKRLGFLTLAGTCAHFARKASDTPSAVLGPTDADFNVFKFAMMRTLQRAMLGKHTQSGKLACAHNTTLWTSESVLCM